MKRPVQEVVICANTSLLLDKVSVKNELTDVHPVLRGRESQDTEQAHTQELEEV